MMKTILVLTIFSICVPIYSSEYSWNNEKNKSFRRKKMEESYKKVEGNLKIQIKEGKISKKDHDKRPSLFSPAAVYANCLVSRGSK